MPSSIRIKCHPPSPAVPSPENRAILTSGRMPTTEEALGMAWWNGMSRSERVTVLDEAGRMLGRDASVSDAWTLWQAGRIRMNSLPSASGADGFKSDHRGGLERTAAWPKNRAAVFAAHS